MGVERWCDFDTTLYATILTIPNGVLKTQEIISKIGNVPFWCVSFFARNKAPEP